MVDRRKIFRLSLITMQNLVTVCANAELLKTFGTLRATIYHEGLADPLVTRHSRRPTMPNFVILGQAVRAFMYGRKLLFKIT